MTTAITSDMIKELRERTGVGMAKCKEALTEAKGNMDEAISILRKAGIAGAVKKEGREANEGLIGVSEDAKSIAIVEINAETDFVVQNSRFKEFLENMTREIATTKPASLEAFLKQKYSKDSHLTIDEVRATIVQTIGENIRIKRLAIMDKKPNHSIAVYQHLGGKIVTVVELEGASGLEELAKEVAMHVAAASPEFLDPSHVPAHIIAMEKDVAQGQMKGKPANIMDKIVEGKLNAFYDTSCLVRQKYIRDDKLSVEEYVSQKAKQSGKTAKIAHFTRWYVGQSDSK